MNLNRLNNIVLSDLESDKLKLEAELERLINKDMDVNEKSKKIKNILKTISDNTQQRVIWLGYTQESLTNLKNKKNES